MMTSLHHILLSLLLVFLVISTTSAATIPKDSSSSGTATVFSHPMTPAFCPFPIIPYKSYSDTVLHSHPENSSASSYVEEFPATASSATSRIISRNMDSTENARPLPVGIDDENHDHDDALRILTGNIVDCLIQSDLKRKGGKDGGSTGWTSWIDDASAYRLKCCMDSVAIKRPNFEKTAANGYSKSEDDVLYSWWRWLRAVPSPLTVDLSSDIRLVANDLVNDENLEMVESTREEFLERIVMNLILLPSGKCLEENIRTPPGAMAYGKLLYGGATRYRLLPGKMRRKTGERTAIMTDGGWNDNVMAWLQYGGPERNYEAVDMGSCAILEVIILPKGVVLEDISLDKVGPMCLYNVGWDVRNMIVFWEPSNENNPIAHTDDKDELGILSWTGKERNDFMMTYFTQNVGGLQSQIESIVRRVLDGRVYRSHDDNGEILGSESFLEAKELESLGLTAVRGLLLYGPPGCGKTALAREISKVLRARDPKVVSAPELLDRWVGGSEKLIRGLFEDAEAELKACGGDATKSSLHVVVIDEIDAVFRKRSASEDSGSATRASAVNQILAKLDGVNAIPNVLIIGMTNRRELLDEALLRPGRLEVQVEIPLPTKEGRREIFQIHFEGLRRSGRLSESLCKAIDGPAMGQNISASEASAKSLFRSRIKTAMNFSRTKIRDLAADSVTGGFSGADIAGLVRCAGSIALARTRAQGTGIDSLLITLDDVVQALHEVKH